MKTLTVCAIMLALSCGAAFGQTYKVLWSFGGAPNDGGRPVSNLVFDKAGNLYGTTQSGGSASSLSCVSDGGCGTVFELSPQGDGSWTETVIYNFCALYSTGTCLDGQNPKAGLASDALGNLYGTTYFGGAACPKASAGCGTVFELSPPQGSGGTWTETVLYNFCVNNGNTCSDGALPNSHLTFDAAGNLYGTTTTGGNGAWLGGTVFELSPAAEGWSEKLLYNFCTNGRYNHCSDGTSPQAGVTFDNAGNLYGTTEAGGTPNGGGAGTVYKLAPSSNSWTETVLVAFHQGAQELGSLQGAVNFDPAGNLYSTASYGGSPGYGGVFRLNTNANNLRALYFNGSDGGNPAAGVLVDTQKNKSTIYGTSTSGTPPAIGGSVFEISPTGKLTVLYGFCQLQNCADGAGPVASLIQHGGRLFGTTKNGGAHGWGVVFEITP
jgi:uncharacterized repeat protein (TIGR03803 family)